MNIYKPSQKVHCNINQSPSHEQLKQVIVSRINQKQIILNCLLKNGGMSTYEAHMLGILAPAARILELRKQGYNINTIQDYDLNGMATYILNKNMGDRDE